MQCRRKNSPSSTSWGCTRVRRPNCDQSLGRLGGAGADSKLTKSEKKKRKKAPGPSRLADAPNPQRGVDDKYWAQRFHYFSLYDCGIQLDAESWYSVTPEKIALAIAARCRPTDVVVDAFCGCGGNAIALARRCRHVVAIDIDAAKVEKARRNARIYGVAVDFVVGDALVLLKTLRADVCFLSPPWGGPGYGADFRLEAIDVQGVDGFGLLRLAAACAPRVAYYLPRTLSVEEAARLAPIVEVESQYLNDKLKAKTVYIGFEEAVPVVASLDGVADALSTIGCAQLLVDDDLRAHNAAASELWRAFFAADEAHRRQFTLADGADSGGYHSSGTLGRYNAHRSGVIYEHDEAVPQLVEGVAFVAQVEAWRGAVTALARAGAQLFGQQFEIGAAGRVLAPDQGDLARRRLALERAGDDLRPVEDPRVDRHLGQHGEAKVIVDHLHQRVQGRADHGGAGVQFRAVTGGQRMFFQAVPVFQQQQAAFLDHLRRDFRRGAGFARVFAAARQHYHARRPGEGARG